MEENNYLLTIEKSGYNISEQPAKGIVEYTIDDGELEYIMQQIKFNQPFVIVVKDDILTFSPQHCISIKISPIKKENV